MDFQNISRELSSAKILGLGESSHGTHEFFEAKSDIIKELVVNHGFNTILFEDSESACEAISSYISSGDGDLESLLQKLYPVWQVKEFEKLILWFRNIFNEYEVKFIGFDIDQTDQNFSKRDELMAKNIKKYVEVNTKVKAIIWAHNSHIQTIGSNFNQKPMGMFLRKYFGTEYSAVALLFGKGIVSATKLTMDGEPGRDRKLSEIVIHTIPPELTEKVLQGLSPDPYLLKNSELNKLDGKLKTVRSIGWGLVPELVNEVFEHTDIANAFDSIVYFPNSTASQPI